MAQVTNSPGQAPNFIANLPTVPTLSDHAVAGVHNTLETQLAIVVPPMTHRVVPGHQNGQ